ncbi:hypothetical protein QNH20_07800 [Neobacillus sp. WH10]|uniref:helix-turn-helix domain-containing protein n=1 Tax=Neobacillus sp. WH10 TaxID=3047873 RepID=UPI0024C1E7F2|nr:helix-turn-helix domain-containing protein [Neobacillus sp. WH10]WHY79023.1 hypothetical protein QNH20_07800 [Neobacillus sp. WH10]
MFGAEYILKLFNSNPNQIAEDFQISKQSVYKWIKKGKIPSERVKQLSEKFGIPEEYFCKNLTKSDELKIQAIKLRNEDIGHDIEFINEDGELEHTILFENEQIALSLIDKSEHLDSIEKLYSGIKQLIKQDDDNFMYEGEPEYKSNLQILNSVTGILKSSTSDKKDVLGILIGIFDLDTIRMDNDMLLEFFPKEEVLRHIPYYKRAFAKDLIQLLLDHGIIKNVIFKNYLEEKS